MRWRKLILKTQMGAVLTAQSTFPLVFPYFIFGMLAVGLARDREDGKREFLAGYRLIGVFCAFAAGVLLVGGGLVLLFRPYLTAAAVAGY